MNIVVIMHVDIIKVLLFLPMNILQCAAGIIFPIIKDEGVRQMFFPATLPAFYRSPPAR